LFFFRAPYKYSYLLTYLLKLWETTKTVTHYFQESSANCMHYGSTAASHAVQCSVLSEWPHVTVLL